jgi:acyl-coenzyme A thioesterase PaaI-like protein
MNKLVDAYNKFSRLPFGSVFFSQAICFKAPYFKSIKPAFTGLRKGAVKVAVKNRRSIQNHLGSINAGALCTLAELVGGGAVEASIPSHLRWIPKGMSVEYLGMAKTDLTGTCNLESVEWQDSMELPVTVEVYATNKELVFRAVIKIHISRKPKH